MTTNLDGELDAIRDVLSALEPLDAAARESVLDYVFKRLNIQRAAPTAQPTSQIAKPPPESTPASPAVSQQLHIKEFKEQKQPRTAIEMAAIVAYYLENIVPEADRKNSVDIDDLDMYFKIAEFKLPAKQQYTLVNAKQAGYFDSVGVGKYQLNAVGHNLVAHSMPRKDDDASTPRKPTKKKKKSKKTTKKKKPSRKKK